MTLSYTQCYRHFCVWNISLNVHCFKAVSQPLTRWEPLYFTLKAVALKHTQCCPWMFAHYVETSSTSWLLRVLFGVDVMFGLWLIFLCSFITSHSQHSYRGQCAKAVYVKLKQQGLYYLCQTHFSEQTGKVRRQEAQGLKSTAVQLNIVQLWHTQQNDRWNERGGKTERDEQRVRWKSWHIFHCSSIGQMSVHAKWL